MAEDFQVTASLLNLRSGPALEAPVLAQLPKGTRVERLAGDPQDLWWKVRSAQGQEGFVARRFLEAAGGGGTRSLPPGVNEVLWARTQAAIQAGVRYKLGGKDSSSGSIDCSGWIAEITIRAFEAVNTASAPESVYDKYDYAALRTHSDGQIAGVAARTGAALTGVDVTAANLREGMLIGCNFGEYGWEVNDPPRRFGIDHIVQVLRDPVSGSLHITQSSSSGQGVNLQPLETWLAGLRSRNMMAQNKVHAVDPFLMADPHTAYFSALTAPTPAVATAAVAAPGQRPAFSGRGAYCYQTADLIGQYGSLDAAVREMQRCRLNHIWVRIHGYGYVGEAKTADPARLKQLIAMARAAGNSVAGWGWCQGVDPAEDAALARSALETFDLKDYVADIEQGVSGAKWTRQEVAAFVDAIRGHADGLAVSSHGFIDYQEPGIFTTAAPKVDCFNPQTYWYTGKPNKKMLDFVHADAADYPLNRPDAYVRLCYDRWTKLYGRPIILSGQTAPEGDFTQAEAEAQLKIFLDAFHPPTDLVGLNYWHWGATTRAMRDTLAAKQSPF